MPVAFFNVRSGLLASSLYIYGERNELLENARVSREAARGGEVGIESGDAFRCKTTRRTQRVFETGFSYGNS